MIARTVRSLLPTLLALALTTAPAAAPPPASPTPPLEPPTPRPFAAVQKLFDQANQAAAVGDFDQALKDVELALGTAQQLGDGVGEARAQRGRALFLRRLNRIQEAIDTWREAARAWKRIGDGPGQVQAVAMVGILIYPQQPKAADISLGRALALAQAETKRPLAAAERLSAAGADAGSSGLLTPARQLCEAALAIFARLAPGSLDLAGGLGNLAAVEAQHGDLVLAKKHFQSALVIEEKLAPGSLELAESLENMGIVARYQGQLAEAKDYLKRALAIKERLAPDSLDVAASLNNLGLVANDHGNLIDARDCYQRALAIEEKLAPDSPEVARSLDNLGTVARQRGDLPAAAQYHQRALAIRQMLAPGSLEVARSLGNLGDVAWDRGELRAAEGYFLGALGIQQRLAPGSLEVAASLNNLGAVAGDWGNLTISMDNYQRALAIEEALAPGSPAVAASLHNLGHLSYVQGDLRAARRYYLDALGIEQKAAPGSLAVAAGLDALATVTTEQGNLKTARDYLQQALSIEERLAPRSPSTAATLNNLGSAEEAGRDFRAAREDHQRALIIEEKLAPGSLAVAGIRNALGIVMGEQGDLPAARNQCQLALEIEQRLAPGSLDTAATLNNLGYIAERATRWPGAAARYQQAWVIVRQQASAVSSDEGSQAFSASTANYGAHLLRAQLALGQQGAAFRTLEEGRAQALRQQLLERQLAPRGVDSQRWTAYRQALLARDQAELALSRAYDAEAHAHQQLLAAREPPVRSAALPELQAVLASAQQTRQNAFSRYLRTRDAAAQRWAAIEKDAPRLFAPPLSLAQSARLLPPGTLFLAYAVGEQQCELFLLRSPNGKPDLHVCPIRLGAKALQAHVRALRADLTDPGSQPTAASHALFAALFPPRARRLLAGTRRLLISPDGPLWELPFAALVTNAHGPRYLGEMYPLTYTPSLTLYAQVRQEPPPPPGPRLALVAAPFAIGPRREVAALPASNTDDGGERGLLVRIGGEPKPLPGSGPEAQQIARLYHAQPLLGAAATEAAVRQQIERAAIIHLATHGYLQTRRAMDSGILLAAPAGAREGSDSRNDGALQAWEIAGQLELHAELVVLSACDTGLGENVPSEGIVGLVRALQIAGARSVVASQWAVADASTAKLMVAFHERLRAGLPKDEGLREAMAVVRRDPATAHPYFWAPFFLTGDPDALTLGRVFGKPSAGHRFGWRANNRESRAPAQR